MTEPTGTHADALEFQNEEKYTCPRCSENMKYNPQIKKCFTCGLSFFGWLWLKILGCI